MNTTGTRPRHINPAQRAVPDLSAYDDDIAIVQGGVMTALSGTSAACPMVAGVLSSINAALAAAGHKTTLGFVNPFLYANEAAFFDITLGNNRGIAAVKGYDPVSGLGAFDFYRSIPYCTNPAHNFDLLPGALIIYSLSTTFSERRKEPSQQRRTQRSRTQRSRPRRGPLRAARC